MRLEERLRDALVAPSPQTAAGERVYPTIAPETAALPRITYQRISTVPQQALDRFALLDQVSMQIDCWARTKAAAAELAREVRLVIADESFKPVVTNEYDGYEGESRLYRHTLDVSCWDKDW